MNSKLIYLLTILLLCSCSKSDIKRNGCGEGAGQSFSNESGCPLYFYNLFTPNGDGANDIFPYFGTCEDVSDFHFIIKKSGRVIMETTSNLDFAWDGKKKGGGDAREGVYDWQISWVRNGIKYKTDGTITLIRDVSKPIKINDKGSCHYIWWDDPLQLE